MFLRFVILFSFASALPVQVKVNFGAKECFLEQLNDHESVTISTIVLQGPQLKAQVEFEGPFLNRDIESTLELHQAIERLDAGHRPSDIASYLHVTEVVDFEHLNLGELDEDDWGDDDDVGEDGGAENSEAREKNRRMKERKKALEARHRQERHASHQHKKVKEEGEAFRKTFKVERQGWYRFCVLGNWYPVTAEVDFRKESELGGVNEQGHVWTYEEKMMAEEDSIMEADTASEEGIKDEDFASTKEKLKTLRRLLAEIQAKQQQERHRLIVHAATNEHSHSRMVLGSLLETMLFMVVTGVQVMTIRRWFKGAPVLGR